MSVFKLMVWEKDPKDYKNYLDVEEYIVDGNVYETKTNDKTFFIKLEKVSENEIIETLNKN